MLKLSNVPAAVYLVALDHMGEDRPDNPADAREALLSAETRRDYQTITARQAGRDISTITAFGLALAQYISLSGPFDEDTGEFSGISGYEI